MPDGLMLQRRSHEPWTLLTGGTGLLGSHVLHELLARGHRVMCLVRARTPAEARRRLSCGTPPVFGSIDPYLEVGQLAVLRGDLHQPQLGLDASVVKRLRGCVAAAIHAAGSTVFESRPNGEPARTNVDGTRAVFSLAADCGCKNWHYVSTAYVCGQCACAVEDFHDAPPAFRNAYEQSKWTAEHESRRAAAATGATLTVHRPGVIVGHSRTGATTNFTGIYYLFRATSLLAKVAEQWTDDRRHIPLRICANATARPNLSFVDDVARDLVDIFESSSATSGVYHLTHPKPPTNRMIKRALERFYRIGGGCFTGARILAAPDAQSDYERMFAGALGALSAYVLESPRFDRRRTDGCARRTPTPWTMSRLFDLLAFAEECDWRPAGQRSGNGSTDWSCTDYFQHFLPERFAQSKLTRLRGLDLEVRYVIEGAADGDWLCRFRQGRLEHVERTRGRTAEVTYRLDSAAFWRAVSGTSTTSDLFLSGGAQIEGDVERALKFAGIVQEFVREFPYDRKQRSRLDR